MQRHLVVYSPHQSPACISIRMHRPSRRCDRQALVRASSSRGPTTFSSSQAMSDELDEHRVGTQSQQPTGPNAATDPEPERSSDHGAVSNGETISDLRICGVHWVVANTVSRLYLAFHRTLPTHFAHVWTSSLSSSRSTVYSSFASTSLLAILCTKL